MVGGGPIGGSEPEGSAAFFRDPDRSSNFVEVRGSSWGKGREVVGCDGDDGDVGDRAVEHSELLRDDALLALVNVSFCSAVAAVFSGKGLPAGSSLRLLQTCSEELISEVFSAAFEDLLLAAGGDDARSSKAGA